MKIIEKILNNNIKIQWKCIRERIMVWRNARKSFKKKYLDLIAQKNLSKFSAIRQIWIKNLETQNYGFIITVKIVSGKI
jgi:hypothetical protein